MAIHLDHTIAWCSDQTRSAKFLTEILGLPPARRFVHFLVVDLANGVSIDFFETSEQIAIQHFAFLVSESEFDEIYRRLIDKDIAIWADPARTKTGEINRNDGGRGVYFLDPDGHVLEIITRKYGSGSP
jgi:catechol 2,3-dioxygenase-like lactoylglutathione lyase family enzyme